MDEHEFALCDQLTGSVKDSAAEVFAFVQNRGVTRALHDRAHLASDSDECVLNDCQPNRISDLGFGTHTHGYFVHLAMTFPSVSTLAFEPGGSRIVDPTSRMIAGPARLCDGARTVRGTTFVLSQADAPSTAKNARVVDLLLLPVSEEVVSAP